MPTTYGNDIVYCLKSHCGVRGYCRQKWVLQVQIICKFSNERTCKRNKDVQGLSCGFEDYLIISLSWTILVVSRPSKCNVSFLKNVFLTQMLDIFSTNLFVCCKYANNWDVLLSVWLLASYAIFRPKTKSKSNVFGTKTPFVVQKKSFYMR